MSIRIYAINNKTVVFWDETASYIVSTLNNKLENGKKFKYNWNKIAIPYNHNYTAYEVKKVLFENKSDLKSIWQDVKTLHNETIDHQHPNLYYTLLRIWSSGVDFSDYKAMITRGCYLNLIFFTLSFFFMYKLLNLIKPDKNFIALGLFFAFILTGSISDTLLIRPYPMSECFFILALYQFVSLYKAIDTEKIIPIKRCILYSIGFALFFLSYYYSIIFMAIASFLITVKCIRTKNKIFWEYFYFIIFSSLVITYLFCPLYFYNLTVTEHLGKTQTNATFWEFMDFSSHGTWLISFLNKYVFYTFVFYIIIFGLTFFGISVTEKNKFEKQNIKTFILLISSTLFFSYIIAVLCPSKEYASVRYIIFLFPVISVVLTILTYILKRFFIIALIMVTIFSSFLPICANIDNSGYLGAMVFYKDFDFFNINNYLYEENSDKPVPVVITDKNNGLWFNYIFFLPSETIVRFYKNENHKINYIFEKFLLINAGERKATSRGKNTLIFIDKNRKRHIK